MGNYLALLPFVGRFAAEADSDASAGELIIGGLMVLGVIILIRALRSGLSIGMRKGAEEVGKAIEKKKAESEGKTYHRYKQTGTRNLSDQYKNQKK